jgi:hypothetical protein
MWTLPSTRGHNFEMEAKLNKAPHLFSKEVFWNMSANFHPILLEDAPKRTKNVHRYMQFYFIKKKMKNLL